MARPKLEKPARTCSLSVLVTPELNSEIEELASKLGMSKSSFLECLLKTAVDDNRFMIKAVCAIKPLFSRKNLEAALL